MNKYDFTVGENVIIKKGKYPKYENIPAIVIEITDTDFFTEYTVQYKNGETETLTTFDIMKATNKTGNEI
jgi:hypothetical protein